MLKGNYLRSQETRTLRRRRVKYLHLSGITEISYTSSSKFCSINRSSLIRRFHAYRLNPDGTKLSMGSKFVRGSGIVTSLFMDQFSVLYHIYWIIEGWQSDGPVGKVNRDKTSRKRFSESKKHEKKISSDIETLS